MLKIVYAILSLVIILGISNFSANAQMTEEDVPHTHNYVFPKSDIYNTRKWAKAECVSGSNVDLFNVLDSGYVIVHEYIMVNCRPCITAGKGLSYVIDNLKKEYPGRIKFFQTVYEDETSCDSMVSWVSQHSFKPDGVFVKGAEEVAFYGGMGMPTIVVLGGGMRHKGYYKKQGYSPRDNSYLITAIKRAIKLSKNKFEQKP